MLKLRSNPSGRFIQVVILLAGIGLIGYWLAYTQFNWTLFRQTFAQMNLWLLLAGTLLAAATYFVRALRWQVMLRPIKADADLWRLVWATIIGFAATVLLGRAGEFVRPYLIARDQGVTISSQIAIWFVERLTDLIAVLLIFGFALFRLDPASAVGVGPEIRWILDSGGKLIAATGAVSLLILIAFRNFSPARVAKLAKSSRAKSFLESLAQGMEATRSWSVFSKVLLYSLLEWALVGACFYALLESFPPTAVLTVRDTLVVLGFTSFGSVVQVPGIGGGMQLVGVIVLHEMYGIAIEPATAVATVLWAIALGITVPPGLLLALHSGISMREAAGQSY